jgi:hypothetical protein
VTPEDRDALNAALDWVDATPVVTEPFHDWILSGAFPAGRPRWENAGARYVEDIEPWERRKLWLLNGAHTLLAFGGLLLGRRTVAEAISDPWLRSAVELLWGDASRQLPTNLDLPAYCAALSERFSNSRIEHRLSQIAQDGTHKLRLRIVPVCVADLDAGRTPRRRVCIRARRLAATGERRRRPTGLAGSGSAPRGHTQASVDRRRDLGDLRAARRSVRRPTSRACPSRSWPLRATQTPGCDRTFDWHQAEIAAPMSRPVEGIEPSKPGLPGPASFEDRGFPVAPGLEKAEQRLARGPPGCVRRARADRSARPRAGRTPAHPR